MALALAAGWAANHLPPKEAFKTLWECHQETLEISEVTHISLKNSILDILL